jgi:hypothetical protein
LAFKENEMAKAQIYLHFKVEGDFHMIKNVPLYQIGEFSFKLKKMNSSIASQYMLIHSKRGMKETSICFESIAVFQNNTHMTISLEAYVFRDKTKRDIVGSIEIQKDKV